MRKRHLLSGIIKCGACGGNFVINGKDYYRCASNREGGCESALSIRKSVIEEAALSVIRERLLTSEMAELFAVEFSKEVERLRASENSDGTRLETQIAVLDFEIKNIARHFTKGAVSDTLLGMLNEREAQKRDLEDRLSRLGTVKQAEVLPHPVLLERYREKVKTAHLALSDETVREEASETLRSLLDKIVIIRDDRSLFAEFVSDPSKIIDFAYDQPATSGRKPVSSIAVVAGVGFEPTTFRL
ncbi:hypothetical protein F7D01_10780 [Erythrobacter sp. 3-20A1M]|nr:hypothetical protein F7D01_10780 [Erythrobacter sp. 3-20A1M]